MPTTTPSAFAASRFESLVPDPEIRTQMLAIFAASLDYLEARRREWRAVRFAKDRLRLFAGRLIVLSIHSDRIWLAVDPSHETLDWPNLKSWQWDSGPWSRYRRVPSRNGYYTPSRDDGNEWPSIRRAHYALLERAITSGMAPDQRTIAKHDAAAVAYVRQAARLSFTHAEVFPVVARLIMKAAAENEGEFITHDTLVSRFLDDATGASLVKRAKTVSSFSSDKDATSNMIAWFSQQVTVGRSKWCDLFERQRRGATWAYRPNPAATPAGTFASDYPALEGEPRLFFHLRRERDPKLAQAKRDAARNSNGDLECEACGFVARAVYGKLAGDLCEIHHRRPLAEVVDAVHTRLEDLAILCPTCHRAIHQTKPLMSVEAFRERFHLRKET